MEIGAKNTENTWGVASRYPLSLRHVLNKKMAGVTCHHDGQSISPPTTTYKLRHTPPTKCLLLLTHPYSSILPSIFFTCLSSNHIFTYTRPHIYPNNLPNPNITSLTSSFNSSQLPASHTSTTSSQISFNLNPNSPFSFLKHPQDFISILLFFYTLSYRLCPKSISISFSNNGKSKSGQNLL